MCSEVCMQLLLDMKRRSFSLLILVVCWRGSIPRSAWHASAQASACAAILHHFKEPVMVVEGKQQYLFDERGRRYLDVCLLLTSF